MKLAINQYFYYNTNYELTPKKRYAKVFSANKPWGQLKKGRLMPAKMPEKLGICPVCRTKKPKRCLDCGCCLVCALKQHKTEKENVCCDKCEKSYSRSDT